uniref:ATP-dependent RNA helicase, putative n=1 Tax=Arundo donax TaxID=35708 RepID=A0A0A9ETC6_ARUDO
MRAWRGSGSGCRCTSTAKPSSTWWSSTRRPS